MAASTIASGAFMKLWTAAVQRAGSMLLQKVLRLRKIDAAIKSAEAGNPLVAKAINDLEIILGSYLGIYNTRLDSFLKELERSGIISAIAEGALLKIDLPETMGLFKREHDRFMIDSSLNADDLYRVIYTSFIVTMSEIAKDQVVHNAIISSHQILTTRLLSVEAAITAFSKRPDVERDMSATRGKIARGLQQSYKDVRIETIRSGARPVEIDKIYIPPKLSRQHTQREREDIGRISASILTSADQSHASKAKIKTYSHHEDTEIAQQLSQLKYIEFKPHFQRVVILGDPGGGKSTLCQKLCYDMCRNYINAVSDRTNHILAQDQRLAVRVILRRFEQARSSSPQLDILSYISRDIVHYASASEEEVKLSLEPMLEVGQIALAFDGLDEILDTSRRREFVDLVTAFCDRFPLCPVIVTSRLVGYDDARLPEGFEIFLLQRFDDSEVEAYLNKFLRVVAGRDKNSAEQEAKRFLTQTERNARDLRRNPLLLGLMAHLFSSKGDVPANRPEIYKDCSTLMFEKWDGNRGIRPDIPSDFERIELFSHLASKIFPDPNLAAGVSKVWLTEHTRLYFEGLYLDKARAVTSARSLVDFITGRAWIMSEIGDGIFAFTHQTFLEYFFARHLDALYDTVRELLEILKGRVERREWDVVAHLALQLKTSTVVRKQDESLRWFSEALTKRASKDHRIAIASFAARSLEYLNGSEGHVKALINRLFLIADEVNNPTSIRPLAESYLYSSVRRSLIRDVASDLLSSKIRSSYAESQSLIGAISPYVRNSAFYALSGVLPEEVASSAREGLRPWLMAAKGLGVWAPVMALQWYGVYKGGSIKAAGLGPFRATYFKNFDFDGLSWLVLASTEQYAEQFRPTWVEPAQLRAALSEIGKNPAGNNFRDFVLIDPSEDFIPGHVWSNIFTELSNDPAALCGARIIQHLGVKVGVGYPEDDYRRAPTERVSKKLQRLMTRADQHGGEVLHDNLKFIDKQVRISKVGSKGGR